MNRRRVALAALLLLAVAGFAVVGGTSTSSAAKSSAYKVAWIYPGPHNDHGWSQAHDAGRLYVEKALGSKIETTYKENIPSGPVLDQTVASLVHQGYQIIFGPSHG